MRNKLDFYLVYFHINDFNLANFQEEIISIFQNHDPIYKYDFQINLTYYLHLFKPSGLIISKLPFKLFSLDDNEDIVEDLFLELVPSVDNYLKGLDDIKFPKCPSYIGIYVSIWPEGKINPKELALLKDKYLNDDLRAYKNFYIDNILRKYS